MRGKGYESGELPMDSNPTMKNDDLESLHVIIARLEPAIALAREQGLSVIAGLLVVALQEAQNRLNQE